MVLQETSEPSANTNAVDAGKLYMLVGVYETPPLISEDPTTGQISVDGKDFQRWSLVQIHPTTQQEQFTAAEQKMQRPTTLGSFGSENWHTELLRSTTTVRLSPDSYAKLTAPLAIDTSSPSAAALWRIANSSMSPTPERLTPTLPYRLEVTITPELLAALPELWLVERVQESPTPSELALSPHRLEITMYAHELTRSNSAVTSHDASSPIMVSPSEGFHSREDFIPSPLGPAASDSDDTAIPGMDSPEPVLNESMEQDHTSWAHTEIPTTITRESADPPKEGVVIIEQEQSSDERQSLVAENKHQPEKTEVKQVGKVASQESISLTEIDRTAAAERVNYDVGVHHTPAHVQEARTDHNNDRFYKRSPVEQRRTPSPRVYDSQTEEIKLTRQRSIEHMPDYAVRRSPSPPIIAEDHMVVNSTPYYAYGVMPSTQEVPKRPVNSVISTVSVETQNAYASDTGLVTITDNTPAESQQICINEEQPLSKIVDVQLKEYRCVYPLDQNVPVSANEQQQDEEMESNRTQDPEKRVQTTATTQEAIEMRVHQSYLNHLEHELPIDADAQLTTEKPSPHLFVEPSGIDVASTQPEETKYDESFEAKSKDSNVFDVQPVSIVVEETIAVIEPPAVQDSDIQLSSRSASSTFKEPSTPKQVLDDDSILHAEENSAPQSMHTPIVVNATSTVSTSDTCLGTVHVNEINTKPTADVDRTVVEEMHTAAIPEEPYKVPVDTAHELHRQDAPQVNDEDIMRCYFKEEELEKLSPTSRYDNSVDNAESTSDETLRYYFYTGKVHEGIPPKPVMQESGTALEERHDHASQHADVQEQITVTNSQPDYTNEAASAVYESSTDDAHTGPQGVLAPERHTYSLSTEQLHLVEASNHIGNDVTREHSGGDNTIQQEPLSSTSTMEVLPAHAKEGELHAETNYPASSALTLADGATPTCISMTTRIEYSENQPITSPTMAKETISTRVVYATEQPQHHLPMTASREMTDRARTTSYKNELTNIPYADESPRHTQTTTLREETLVLHHQREDSSRKSMSESKQNAFPDIPYVDDESHLLRTHKGNRGEQRRSGEWTDYKVSENHNSSGARSEIRKAFDNNLFEPGHGRVRPERTSSVDADTNRFTDVVKNFYEVAYSRKHWWTRRSLDVQTHYITASFAIYNAGLNDIADDLICELTRWAEAGNAVCCEIVWSVPCAYRDLSLEQQMREAVAKNLVQSKWNLCDALGIWEVPLSQVEEAEKFVEDAYVMWMYRQFCKRLLDLTVPHAAADYHKSWFFDSKRLPWVQLQEMFSARQLEAGSVAVAHFVILKV